MIAIIIGIISGIFTGLGMGGGTILIVFLTYFLNIDQKVAQATNLIFFFFSAISVCMANTKYKQIKYKIAIPIALVGIIGAIIGAQVTTMIETNILRKMFGAFLIIIAMCEIYKVIKEKK